jgi:Mlc titration factor MtfA (ptsG expression regulator)
MSTKTLEILMVSAIVGYILIRFIRTKDDKLDRFKRNREKYKTPVNNKEQQLVEDTLGKRFFYYNGLSDAGKKRFIQNCIRVLRVLKFEGREGLEVTLEMKVTVAAAFAQVSFGLDRYVPDYLHTVLVYPQSFFVPEISKQLKGGITPNGFMAVSWKDLEEGFQVPHDGFNLGLHEVAHAFKIDAQHHQTEQDFFAFYINRWLSLTQQEYERIRSGASSSLREYGGTNPHEFFAVCVEHFFEVPEGFHLELPDIYNHLCVLLNQNPLNRTGDYELTKAYVESVNKDESRLKMPWVINR